MSTRAPAKSKVKSRVFDARPDTLDFRDKMFTPTLVEVPTDIDVKGYLKLGIPVLDQESEGACTGFGLATVANFLLSRRVRVPDKTMVSPRMLYELARRYDEWPGENYPGSSARGAMKGWNKHGVCGEPDWPYRANDDVRTGLTEQRIIEAKKRPLGAYFRVNHLDLIALHTAIAEVGILYASAVVHDGWNQVGPDGIIPYTPVKLGGHAFAIVAYDQHGLWIQNSWGKRWGRKGLARISYDDWLENGTDVWVARLGAPVVLNRPVSYATIHGVSAGQAAAYSYGDLRPHLVSLGNDGELKPGGDYGTTEAELATIFNEIQAYMAKQEQPRLLLYAHGGLVDAQSATQRVAEYRPALLKAGIYPLAFIWHTDFWTTIRNILQDAVRRRRPEGPLDQAKDFMLDRLDDALEPLARTLTGKAAWSEMKENAHLASREGGGARKVLEHIVKLRKAFPALELHILGHSAGSILHAPIIQMLTAEGSIADGPMKGETGLGLNVASCTLWAPACTIDLFRQTYAPAIKAGSIGKFALYCLSDKAERDDHCARIYNKSLLYLVSHAFEAKQRIPLVRGGTPILGMEKFALADDVVTDILARPSVDLVVSPNNEDENSLFAAMAEHHGDFDNDIFTVKSTFRRIEAAGTSPRATATAPARTATRKKVMVRGLRGAPDGAPLGTVVGGHDGSANGGTVAAVGNGNGSATAVTALTDIVFQHSQKSLVQRRMDIDSQTGRGIR